MDELRHCRGCNFVKQMAEFYTSSPRRCKACVRSQVAKRRAENIEAIRAYDRGRGFRGKPTLSADYKAKYPKRRAAHIAIGNAVHAGRIVPWPTCALPECYSKPEAHHPDYDAPLDVVWLCPPHHKQAHALLRRV